jgi:hypothetical protein
LRDEATRLSNPKVSTCDRAYGFCARLICCLLVRADGPYSWRYSAPNFGTEIGNFANGFPPYIRLFLLQVGMGESATDQEHA